MKASFQITKLDYWVYGISIALCFLLFKQSDLTVTNNASFAYLHGHFWDFYDYNKTYFDNNYLPIFYWIFALWNLPLKLLGFIPQINQENWLSSTPIVTIWSKLLLAIFFFASVNLIKKISDQIISAQSTGNHASQSVPPNLLFATSPFAIFAAFIFGGYDIFGVFFTLLGLRAYFSKQFKWFIFWFSVAISFKYFAALIYLPLVLIVEKRITHLLVFGLLGLAGTVLQLALYWHSSTFLNEIVYLIGTKTTDTSVRWRLIAALVAYMAMCLYLYFSKMDFKSESQKWHQYAIFACLFAYALLFSSVRWHPQWLILMIPLICLSYLFIKSQKSLLIIETLGYVGFIALCINTWIGNVDVNMVYGGVFGDLLPKVHLLGSELIGRRFLGISRTAFYIFLYSPLLLLLSEQWPASKDLIQKYISVGSNSLLQPVTALRLVFTIRFFVAAYAFILLSLACLGLA
jgi:hypothetical protein